MTTQSRVYPRVGGGNGIMRCVPFGNGGLSPRGRGKRRYALYAPHIGGSIPAWAGETPRWGHLSRRRQVYPRVGGGNRQRGGGFPARRGLSPRGRGKRRHEQKFCGARRSIPAWAGETAAIISPPFCATVYPRVGGGNEFPQSARAFGEGLSPRGRGKP